MYDPKFRFVILVSMMILALSGGHAIYFYVFQPHSLSLSAYASGITALTSAVAGGFIFVWLSSKFISIFNVRRGEQDLTEEGFNFPVRLSKYTPDIVAPPELSGKLHPLEMELLGFLNAFHAWPYDPNSKSQESLYEHSVKCWAAVSEYQHATHMHRIAALAQDLERTVAFQEHRSSESIYKFWRRDTVTYSQQAPLHGGMSAFVLSTFPNFNELGAGNKPDVRDQRALLTALRYKDDRSHMPTNCDSLAKEIYETLHKANHALDHGSSKDLPSELKITDAIHAEFKREITDYLPSVIRSMDTNSSDLSADSDGCNLSRGRVVIKLGHLLNHIAEHLSPKVRNHFHLWEISESSPHPAWPHLLGVLSEMGVLVEEWEDVQATGGTFQLTLGEYAFPNSVILHFDKNNFPALYTNLTSMKKYTGIIEIDQPKDKVLNHIHARAAQVDKILKIVQTQAITAKV